MLELLLFVSIALFPSVYRMDAKDKFNVLSNMDMDSSDSDSDNDNDKKSSQPSKKKSEKARWTQEEVKPIIAMVYTSMTRTFICP
jgi:hypothetical protein